MDVLLLIGGNSPQMRQDSAGMPALEPWTMYVS